MKKNKERIAFLKKRLEMYYEAEEKILQGQSYTIGSRTLTRTSLANVQSKIKELESEISALETRGNSKRRSGSNRTFSFLPFTVSTRMIPKPSLLANQPAESG